MEEMQEKQQRVLETIFSRGEIEAIVRSVQEARIATKENDPLFRTAGYWGTDAIHRTYHCLGTNLSPFGWNWSQEKGQVGFISPDSDTRLLTCHGKWAHNGPKVNRKGELSKYRIRIENRPYNPQIHFVFSGDEVDESKNASEPKTNVWVIIEVDKNQENLRVYLSLPYDISGASQQFICLETILIGYGVISSEAPMEIIWNEAGEESNDRPEGVRTSPEIEVLPEVKTERYAVSAEMIDDEDGNTPEDIAV